MVDNYVLTHQTVVLVIVKHHYVYGLLHFNCVQDIIIIIN